MWLPADRQLMSIYINKVFFVNFLLQNMFCDSKFLLRSENNGAEYLNRKGFFFFLSVNLGGSIGYFLHVHIYQIKLCGYFHTLASSAIFLYLITSTLRFSMSCWSWSILSLFSFSSEYKHIYRNITNRVSIQY